MKKHKTRVVVLENGRLVIDGLPVRKGQQVEVTITIEEQSKPLFPLRGLPVRYHHPFEPATDESDWDVLK